MGLFDNVAEIERFKKGLGLGAVLLHGFALPDEALLLTALHKVIEQAPFRHMVTPGGFRMSVAMTNCGSLGWISDRAGYRYEHIDPDQRRELAAHARFLRETRDRSRRGGRLPAI